MILVNRLGSDCCSVRLLFLTEKLPFNLLYKTTLHLTNTNQAWIEFSSNVFTVKVWNGLKLDNLKKIPH